MSGTTPEFTEALAWLGYCLAEAEAAMGAVKAAAKPGTTCVDYHEICEMSAKLVTFRARCARWLRGGSS